MKNKNNEYNLVEESEGSVGKEVNSDLASEKDHRNIVKGKGNEYIGEEAGDGVKGIEGQGEEEEVGMVLTIEIVETKINEDGRRKGI